MTTPTDAEVMALWSEVFGGPPAESRPWILTGEYVVSDESAARLGVDDAEVSRRVTWRGQDREVPSRDVEPSTVFEQHVHVHPLPRCHPSSRRGQYLLLSSGRDSPALDE